MTIFQVGWDVVKDDLMRVFGKFFHNGVVNAVTNSTFICLIPKKINSLRLKTY